MDASAIIAQLATYPGLPRTALLAAGRQRREMAPLFAREIEKCLSDASGRPAQDEALFFMFHLLGSWRETSAYRPLARLLRLPEEELDEIMGDGLTETAHRVMAAVFDGDPQPIHDIVLDPLASAFTRSSMCEALVILVLEGRLDRAGVACFLRDCFMHLRPQAECAVWSGWQEAIAVLGLKELSPLVEKAFQRGYVTSWCLTFEDFQGRLEAALENPGRALDVEGNYYTPFGDTIEELSQWYAFSGEGERQRRLEGALNRPKDVGRNDPCPCGSGKKYKKCCLN